jgi:hypothetical protein
MATVLNTEDSTLGAGGVNADVGLLPAWQAAFENVRISVVGLRMSLE